MAHVMRGQAKTMKALSLENHRAGLRETCPSKAWNATVSLKRRQSAPIRNTGSAGRPDCYFNPFPGRFVSWEYLHHLEDDETLAARFTNGPAITVALLYHVGIQGFGHILTTWVYEFP